MNASAVEPAIALSRDSAIPLPAQIADALRQAAADGRLRGGDRLPSTRVLARQLGVSRTVTAAAYEQLHAEGWISGVRGSGTYVTTTPPAAASRLAAAPAAPRGPGPEQETPLVPGAPWAEGVDTAAWRRAWRAAADHPPDWRTSRAGLPEYRAAVLEHLLRHRGLAVTASADPVGNVLATGGTTAAVSELAAVALRPGDVVAVEEPGYQRAVAAFRDAGVHVVPAPVDRAGVLVEGVPSGVRAVYCSPAHQYPLGGRLPAERRIALVERARTEGWLVVEDDYDGELRYDVSPLPVLASLAPDVVVHLGTTSKLLSPTLGVGWMVAPAAVLAAVLDHRERTGTGPAPAGQRLLVEFARTGDLARHLRRLRRELSRRRAEVVRALEESGVPVFGDQAGAHVVVPLPSAEAERDVLARAREEGLVLDGLARHHQGEQVWCGIALGFAACPREELHSALSRLVRLCGGTAGAAG
ncbi:MocR-like pyridoxine biosynthesis transcription factor PdxR [Salinifilum ghardaiensis]